MKEQKIIAEIGDANLQENSQKIYLGREPWPESDRSWISIDYLESCNYLIRSVFDSNKVHIPSFVRRASDTAR